jgi:non-ribosomal peptide synthetase component E (peptide arylation enzyme)
MSKKEYLEGATPYPQDVIDEYGTRGWWLNMTYGDLLDRSTSLYPDKPAVIDGSMQLTYAELKEKVDRLAIALLKLGIKKYDRLLLQLPNRHEFVVAFYAMQRIGAVPVLAVPRQEYHEISHFFKVMEPIGWIAPMRDGNREFLPLIGKIRAESTSLKHLIMVNDNEPLPSNAFYSMEKLIEDVALSDYPADYLRQFRPDPNDVAVIYLTGGTTGLPKGVPRTHNSFHTNVRYTNSANTPDDVCGLVTPIGHTMAHQGPVGGSIMYGCTLVLIPVPRAKPILEAIQKYRITKIGFVPTQLEDILNYPDLDNYDLSSVRMVGTTGAPLRPDTAERAAAFLKRIGAEFRGSGFGSTEGPCAGSHGKERQDIPRGAIGRPMCEGDRWKVLDDDGRELPLNTEGELVARGPCVFTGYYKSEEENKTIFTRDGYYKMGDLGKIDEQGNIYITGRKKDIIQRGGEGIIPSQIENLLHRLPAVLTAAVVGMPDPRLGERACAYVVLKPGKTMTFDEMIAGLKGLGAGVLQFPERLEIVEELPKTAVGKVDKKALRGEIAEKLKAEGVVS